jgi:hypothetical protein
MPIGAIRLQHGDVMDHVDDKEYVHVIGRTSPGSAQPVAINSERD